MYLLVLNLLPIKKGLGWDGSKSWVWILPNTEKLVIHMEYEPGEILAHHFFE
jgi:hypothetical protein